jgi:nitroimidazol reductase NimA-like FMN-containing flavoprotein (pyridoxamine 5'-phosphate oxidase superfamily)
MLGTLDKEGIESVLGNNMFGRLGCHSAGRTYVVPVNYAYDGKHIIGHSMPGMKIRMMRNNPQVCFEVDEVSNFSNWKSVIVWGEYQEISDTHERSRAMKFLVDRTLQLKVSKSSIPLSLAAGPHPHFPADIKPVIYRIVIAEKTGRYEKD